MNQQVTNRQTFSAPPAPASRELSTRISHLSNRLTQDAEKPWKSNILTPIPNGLRAELEDRAAHLRAHCQPCDRLTAAKAISQMMLGFPQVKPGDHDDTRAQVAAYLAQVAECPTWAVLLACKEMGGRKSPFPPSAGELAAAARATVQPFDDELRKIARLLSAEPAQAGDRNDRNDRNAMRAKIAALREELGAPAEGKARALTQDEAEAWLERQRDAPKDPIKVSAALSDLLGKQAMERAARG